MNKEQWVMNRAGLVNFWYYDEETFELEDGKLLLRGANGSGKSVTMQSFLPVLLDGRKSPDRLDPFGSKARKMEDYLLGEKEVVNRDERTGYLFIEYVKKETGQYMTTGIGMQAKRNKQLKSWYFVIIDNRRIGIDFSLTLNHTGEKIPMSEKELTNRIGTGGHVVQSQKDYMELVNRYVFGFQSAEAYEDLIKLLIQLRSPKLSKDFKPTVIYEILESALPPLTDDEIRYLSDSIDHMDQAQQELENLKKQKESVGKLLSIYDRYNRYVLAEKAKQWKFAEERVAQKLNTVKQLKCETADVKDEIAGLQEKEKELSNAQNLLEKEKDQLNRHEVWTLEEKKKDLEKDVEVKNKASARLENNRDSKQKDYVKKKDELSSLEAEEYKTKDLIEELLDEMGIQADESDFAIHDVNQGDFERLTESYDFSVWKKEVREHQSKLLEASKVLEEKSRLQQRFRDLERTSSEQKLAVDQIQQQIDHSQQWFIEERQQLESAVFAWVGDRDELSFTDGQRQQLARTVQGLFEETEFEQVKNILLESLDEYRGQIQSQAVEQKNCLKVLEEAIEEKQQQISKLKHQKMIEPVRAEGTALFREKLQEEEVSAVPFYEAVEFQDDVPEKERSRIESVLRQTGILDSLISEEQVKPVEDAVLRSDPLMMTQTLADYLKPDVHEGSAVSLEKVDEVLRSIPLEQTPGAFSIDIDGSYAMGIVNGHAPEEGPAKFIGRSSRKRYLKERIAQLTEELSALYIESDRVCKQINQLQQILDDVKMWQQTIPSEKDLREIFEQKQQLENDRKVQQALLDQIDRQWKDIQVELSRLKQQLYEYSSQFSFHLDKESVELAQDRIKEYEGHLYQLENTMVKSNAIREKIMYLEKLLIDIEEELDYLKGEMNVEQDAIARLKNEIRSTEHQLDLKGVEEIRVEIRRVQHELAQTKDKLSAIIKEIPQKQADLQRISEKLDVNQTDAEFWTRIRNLWEQKVTDEVNYSFVEVDIKEPSAILLKYGDVLTSYDKSKILEQLSKAFHDEQIILSEYRMSHQTENSKMPEWMKEEQEERFEAYVREYSTLKDRRIIRLYYNGSPVNPYYLSEVISRIYDEQERNLDEQDRKLYEDIMLNHIGTILRSRIKRAAQWVRKMDKIMSERDNSSGLIFSIAWKAQTAESEDEMDTADLVKLLERESRFLKEEDLSKITRHFQARIAKAKEIITLRNEGSTLHQVLKEVLDYRKWFSFVLSFKRENEPAKRELTNNAFFQFSGGEKAMAMYIPLFTAAYSRYKEAGDFAPYIISLDEAFAGVDENNIRDMFEVVEQLGFNYIMNSQALWGDYDTVRALAIAELLRPKNADFVTVMRYKWDGIQRKPVVLKDQEEIFQ